MTQLFTQAGAAFPDFAELQQELIPAAQELDTRVFGFPAPQSRFVLNPPTPQSLFSEFQEDLRQRREEATDRLIAARRDSLTPLQRVIIQDKRRQSRITVREIGQLSEEALRAGIQPHDAFDDRSSVVKFLDMIDLPRNTIANIAWGTPTAEAASKSLLGTIASGAGVGALASGLLGPGVLGGAIVGGLAGLAAFIGAAGVAGVLRAFTHEPDITESFSGIRMASSGQRAIYFSDILDRLGVDGKVKRAIIGFVGDVLMDPLTYLSGGGNVVGITLRSGARHPLRVAMSKPFIKQLRQLEREIIANGGKMPDTPLARQLAPLFQADQMSLTTDTLGNLVRTTGKIDSRTYEIGDSLLSLQPGETRLPDLINFIKENKKALGTGEISFQQFRHNHGALSKAIENEIGFFANTNPLTAKSPIEFDKIVAAQNVIRRHAARSSIQFTFPMMGFIANRFPGVFGAWNGSVPIFRVGTPARIQKVLRRNHDEFMEDLRTRTAARLAETNAKLDDALGTPDNPKIFLSREGATQLPPGVPRLAVASGEEPLAEMKTTLREMEEGNFTLYHGTTSEIAGVAMTEGLAQPPLSRLIQQVYQANDISPAQRQAIPEEVRINFIEREARSRFRDGDPGVGRVSFSTRGVAERFAGQGGEMVHEMDRNLRIWLRARDEGIETAEDFFKWFEETDVRSLVPYRNLGEPQVLMANLNLRPDQQERLIDTLRDLIRGVESGELDAAKTLQFWDKNYHDIAVLPGQIGPPQLAPPRSPFKPGLVESVETSPRINVVLEDSFPLTGPLQGNTGYNFILQGAEGQPLGVLDGTLLEGGRVFKVDFVGGGAPEAITSTTDLGTSGVREILEQLRFHFPNLRRVEGIRETGAKAAARAGQTQAFDVTKFAPKAPGVAHGLRVPLRSITRQERNVLLENGWRYNRIDFDPIQIERLKEASVSLDHSRRAQRLLEAEQASFRASMELKEATEALDRLDHFGEIPLPTGLKRNITRVLDDAERDLKRAMESDVSARNEVLSLLQPQTLDVLEAADNILSSSSRGDLLTSHRGFLGLFRKAFLGVSQRAKDNQRLHIERGRLENIKDLETRPLILTKEAAIRRKKLLDPWGLGDSTTYERTAQDLHEVAEHNETLLRIQAEIENHERLRKATGAVPPRTWEVPLEPVPEGYASVDDAVVLKRGKDRIFVRFGNIIDRMLYEAEPRLSRLSAEKRGRVKWAQAWLRRNLGLSKGAIDKERARLFQQISDEIGKGRVKEIDLKALGKLIETEDEMEAALEAMAKLANRMRRGATIQEAVKTDMDAKVAAHLNKTAGAAVGGPDILDRIFDASKSQVAIRRERWRIRPTVKKRRPKRFKEAPPAEEMGVPPESVQAELFEKLEFTPQTQTALKRLGRMQDEAQQTVNEGTDVLNHIRQLDQDIYRADIDLEAHNRYYDAQVRQIGREIDEINSNAWYRRFDRLTRFTSETQRAIRDVTRIGIKGKRAAEPLRELSRVHENIIPLLQRTFYQMVNRKILSLNRRLGVVTKAEDVRAAVYWKAMELSGATGRNALLEDDALLKVINRMREDEKKALMLDSPEVTEAAGDLLTIYNQFLHQARERGLLPYDFDPEWVYLPLTLTEKAREAARLRRLELGLGGGALAGTDRMKIKKPFMLQRSTNRLRLQKLHPRTLEPLSDENGPIYVTIYKGQIKPDKTSPYDVVLNDPNPHEWEIQRRLWVQKLVKENPEALQSGDRWDLGFRDTAADRLGTRWMPDEHPTSPYHLNEDADNFRRLVGDDYIGDIFETDPIVALTRRTGEQFTSQATDTFRALMLPQVRVMSQREVALLPDGTTKGTKVHEGIEYRALNMKIINDSTMRLPVTELLPFPVSPDSIQLWPEDLATEMENFARAFKTDDSTEKLMSFVDRVVTAWKGAVLYLPRWAVINLVGSGMMGIMAGSNPVKWPGIVGELIKPVFQIHGMGGGPFAAFEATKKVKIGKTKGDVVDRLIDLGSETMRMDDLLKQMLLDGIINSARVMQEILTPMALAAPEGKMLASIVTSHHPIAKPLGWWFKVNAAWEDLMRATIYVELRRQGHSRHSAQSLVSKFLFDYGDLSFYEKKWGTRLLPFYRWQRNNIALQVKFTMEKPAYASLFPKAMNALDEAFEDEASLPKNLQPRWLRDQLALQVFPNRESAIFVALNSSTPAQELFEMGQLLFGAEGIVDFMSYFMSGTNPLVKNAYEIASRHEAFTGKKIGPLEEGGAVTFPEYFARQTGVFYEALAKFGPDIGQALVPGGEEGDLTAGIMRFFIGGRLQKRELDSLIRQKRFLTGETATRLRFAVRRAVEEGDQDRARELALRYVEMHRQLWDMGMIDLVPKALRGLFRRQDFQERVNKPRRTQTIQRV